MRKQLWSLLGLLALVSGSQAQVYYQPVAYPQVPTVMPTQPIQVQTPVFVVPNTVQTVGPGVVSTQNPCPCPCPPGPSGQCSDTCTNPPKITYHPERCPPTKDCKPIPVEYTPQDPANCINITFYGKPVSYKYDVDVPVIQEECKEVFRFKDVTIDFICCSVTVCVPCEVCWEKAKKCVLVKKNVNVEALRRQDGTIDVYILGIAGMPKKYVHALKMSEADFKTKFPNQALPTYP